MERNHSVPQQPERIRLSVLLLGFISLVVLLYATYVLFYKGDAPTQRRGSPAVQPVRKMQQAPAVPDHTGDLASSSNRAVRMVRDTNRPIEVRAVISGAIQRSGVSPGNK